MTRRPFNFLAILAFWTLTALGVGLWSLPAWAAETVADLPLPAQRVLGEVSRLMDRKAYDAALGKLTDFRKRGASSGDQDAADPHGRRHPLIDLALGNLYLLMEDYPNAKTVLRQVVTRLPRRADAWLNLAKACYETRDYGCAAGAFAEAYRRSAAGETDPAHLYFAAVSHQLGGADAEAVAVFERLFAAHPDRIKPRWRENFVHALMAVDKPRRALPLVRQLVRQSSGETRLKWQEMLLHLYLRLKMTSEARAFARQLAHEAPGEARWWKALAHVELSAGRYADALAALTVYGYLRPLSEAEQRLWADLNLQLDIPDQAAPVYARLLKQKNNPKLREKLISAYRQTGRYDEALALLARHGADDPAALMLRADLLYSARRFAEAADAYRLAALKNKEAAGQAWLMAGYAAWQVDDLETSRQAFRRASRFAPQKKAALSALQQIEAIN
jgi:tetratricopeptide (TPR) repeat protein